MHHQGAVRVDKAGGSGAGEVKGEVAVVVVRVGGAARGRTQVRALRVEPLACQIWRHWERPAAACDVCAAPLCAQRHAMLVSTLLFSQNAFVFYVIGKSEAKGPRPYSGGVSPPISRGLKANPAARCMPAHWLPVNVVDYAGIAVHLGLPANYTVHAVLCCREHAEHPHEMPTPNCFLQDLLCRAPITFLKA